MRYNCIIFGRTSVVALARPNHKQRSMPWLETNLSEAIRNCKGYITYGLQ
jgi:hypothetical protein